MLTLFHGTNLQKLADRLFKECRDAPGGNPLTPEILIVQNHGMGQWLSTYRAQQEGITANMEFEFPAERMWKLVRVLHPELPETLPSDRGPMTWGIMRLLEEQADAPAFSRLRFYIEDDDPGQEAIRRWKLSNKIADIFDQYLIYRPDLLRTWQAGEYHFEAHEAERWQAELWRRLQGYWQKDDGQPSMLHRTDLQQDLFHALDNGKLTDEDVPPRLSIFGVSGMPPELVKTLVKLSKITDISFYQLTPDATVHAAPEFEHPLLQSLGKTGADFSRLLHQQIEADSQVQNHFKSVAVEANQRTESSVLGRLQRDIKSNGGMEKKASITYDYTIQVHSCHSAMREVEVLYNQLLAMFDARPDLHPDEVLIMTPDIETYAPMVRSVFGTPDEGQPQIPFGIADRDISESHPVLQTFMNILDLLDSRFKVTDLLDLLDANPVREVLEIRSEEIDRLEQWIGENRIRWGIDGSFKEQLGLPGSSNFSWRAGLYRMLLGYAMEPEDDQLFDGIYPYNEISSSDDAVLAGKLARFLHLLFELQEKVQAGKTIAEWAAIMESISGSLLPDSGDTFGETAQIHWAIDQLKAEQERSGYESNIPFRLIRSWFRSALEKSGTGGGRFGRGVTFSSMMPMRSIPFKVIGMIGMDEEAFPRSSTPLAFDLMHAEHHPGDPIRSEEDRYLFLESLLSARDYLYFSYIGQSNREDADFPPSVVLTEFLDYLENAYGVEMDSIVQEHPLQAFSPLYFKEGNLISYSAHQKKVSEQLLSTADPPRPWLKESLPIPPEREKNVSVAQLISFYQHPVKYVLQNRMGIYLRELEVLSEDREPFELDGLENFQVGQELLDRYLKKESLPSYQKVLEARDRLPEGWTGKQAFKQKREEVRLFGTAIDHQLGQDEPEDLEVNTTLGKFQLTGKISNIYPAFLLEYRFGSMRPKDLITLWIKHLVLQAEGAQSHPTESRLFVTDRYKTLAEYRLSAVTHPKELLEGLLDGYWQGLQQFSYLFPRSSYAYAEQILLKEKDQEEGLKKATKAWEPSHNGYPGEREDPYIQLAVGGYNPLADPEFKEAATSFWKPFFDVMNRERR